MDTEFDSSSELRDDVPDEITLEVENVGGIDETSVTFSQGVTVLTGRNASNRTSLLQGAMAALGSDDVSLKADADSARVRLSLEDRTLVRRFERTEEGIVSEGDRYLDDPILADLFAFLLESNEARRTVTRNENARELMLRPVDTEEIEARIDRKVARKRELDRRLDDLDDLERLRAELEETRRDRLDELDELRAELADVEAELAAMEASPEEAATEQEELESTLDELRKTRTELERTDERIRTERESIEALEDELDEARERLETLPTVDDGRLDAIESELDDLRSRKAEIDGEINQLRSTIEFNEQLLEGDDGVLATALDRETGNDSPTDQLVSESVVCWTCGSTTDRDRIEGTVDRLRSALKDRLEKRREIEENRSSLRDEQRGIEEKRDQVRRVEGRIDDLNAELEERSDRLDTLRADRSELVNAVAKLESTVEELETEDHSELLDVHRRANELEFEIERVEGEIGDIEDELDEVDGQFDERERLEDERARLSEELTELRTRIERIETEAVEQFEHHMQNVLDILEYDNIDAIRIDRNTEETTEGRRSVERTRFDIVVARRTNDGAVYRDSIEHLSESEREVTGLIFGLAGYLVHDVHEIVPFMLLDSLEAIDSRRIANLVSYFESYVPYLVVALLEEDARELDTGYDRVSDI